MWVDHRQVERSVSLVGVGQSQEHSTVDSWVTLVGRDIRLDGHSSVDAVLGGDVQERRVSDIQLADPHGELRSASSGGGNVGVVWTDLLSWVLPLEVDLTSWVGERDGAVLGKSGRAVKAGDVVTDARVNLGQVAVAWSDGAKANSLVGAGLAGVAAENVRLVQDGELREVLPDETLGVSWARRDVWGEEGPGP